MSTALRDVADATMQTLTDLVDDARQHIDIPRVTHKKSHAPSPWFGLVVVALAVVVAVMVRRQKATAAAAKAARA
jgi:hypothetical protein